MIPDCDGRSDGRTESIIAKTALCIASYADALSKSATVAEFRRYLAVFSDSRTFLRQCGQGEEENLNVMQACELCGAWQVGPVEYATAR